MGAWIFLILISAVALYFAASLNRPPLMLATAIATGLGIFMLLLRLFVGRRMKKTSRRR